MPQVQLPIFPAGVTHINSEVAFEERDGKVYYFNGHLPVFVHEKSALATFRLFSTQLVINGNATQAEISRAFGVPLVTVKRKRLTNCTVYGDRYFRAAQALGVSSATRLNGKSAKPGSTELR